MKRQLLTMLAAVLTASFTAARAADFTSAAIGTTGADFLNLAVDARAVGMGSAYSAVAPDATALYWNPAGLTNIEAYSASVMHAPYIASSYFDYASYGQNLGQYGAFGVSWQYFSLGSITQTNANGSDEGSLTPYDMAITAGYAYKLQGLEDGKWGLNYLDGFSLGVAAKFIQAHIVTAAETEAFDLGVLSPGYLDNKLHLAFTADNIGGTLKFDSANENLPMAFKVGSAYQINEKWLASLDLAAPRGGNPYLGIGTEYVIYNDKTWSLAGRAGYNSLTEQSISGFSGASFGFGIGYRGLSIDYAIVPMGGLGQAQRISLTYNFGKSAANSSVKP